ncbi:MAG TPA: hypothetical protein VFH33_03280, partial [Candidatus Krumholzibacteria bacterium]|nr:hypothetical protein [Candidatus Krumholzibacteria bacterium]
MRHAIRLLIPILLFAVPARAQWTVDGVGVCTASGNQNQPKIASDGAGGWIMTWTDSRSGTQDIYAQRVDGTGTPLWTANGVVVCSAANTQIEPRIVSDGNEGAIVTWQDGRTGTYDIYAQLIDPGGAAVWAANGVPICTAPDTQQLPEIVADAFGGAVITWSDLRNGGFNPDIYAQRINVAGVAQWTANGVPICNDPGYQDAPTLILAGYNSIIIAWGDQRYGNTDVYAQRMNLAGAPQWAANGVPVCTALGFQDGIVMVGDFFGGAILAWRDTRSGPV